MKRLRRRRRTLLRLGAIVFSTVLCAAGLAALVFATELFAVRGIVVEGNAAVRADAIVEEARASLSAARIGPLSGNLLFLPKSRIVGQLAARFPRLETIELQRDFRTRTLRIVVTERFSVGIYCYASALEEALHRASGSATIDDTLRALTIRACFLIDRHGIVFADAPETEGGLIVSILDTIPDDQPVLGRAVMSPDQLDAIVRIWDRVRAETRIGLKNALRLDTDTLSLLTLEGWTALFDVRGDIDPQVTALRELLAKELPRDKRRTISIIDLRTPGRIYYR